MLKQRLLTALLLVVLFAGVLASGSLYALGLLLAGAVCIAASEWFALTLRWTGNRPWLAGFGVAALFIWVTASIPATAPFEQITAWTISILWFSIAINLRVSAGRFWILERNTLAVPVGVLLLVTSAWMWMHLVETGARLHLLLLVVSVVLADSGAYFVGRRFGRRKLAPAVSPSKTVEGMVGGLLVVLVMSLLLAVGLGTSAGDTFFLALTCVLAALFSVVGDLFESAAKRRAGVKDSGSLLPGHGGVLDRVDGLLAATPVFVLMQSYFPVPL